jgi:hypothetical protein
VKERGWAFLVVACEKCSFFGPSGLRLDGATAALQCLCMALAIAAP